MRRDPHRRVAWWRVSEPEGEARGEGAGPCMGPVARTVRKAACGERAAAS